MLTAEGAEEPALFMPSHWFGIIMFAFLLFALLITFSFSNKGRELPAEAHPDH
ncbi:MAG: hypothetical protein ACTHV8_05175 [Nesterenkonia sp.]